MLFRMLQHSASNLRGAVSAMHSVPRRCPSEATYDQMKPCSSARRRAAAAHAPGADEADCLPAVGGAVALVHQRRAHVKPHANPAGDKGVVAEPAHAGGTCMGSTRLIVQCACHAHDCKARFIQTSRCASIKHGNLKRK